jgi:tRNA(Ile2) C34 agmatinyltransferase TiaS
MTKKDYELIADVFANHKKRYGNRTDAVVNEVIMDMTEALKDENSKFSSYRFITACGVTSPKCPKCSRYMNDAGDVFVCENDSCGYNL